MLTADDRAAIQERINETAMWAPDVVRAIRYMPEEDAVEMVRSILRLNEGMRIQLELCGLRAPELRFQNVEEEEDGISDE